MKTQMTNVLLPEIWAQRVKERQHNVALHSVKVCCCFVVLGGLIVRVQENRDWSYIQLDEYANKVAHFGLKMGLKVVGF